LKKPDPALHLTRVNRWRKIVAGFCFRASPLAQPAKQGF
jgi:hypothetical protein